MSEQFEVEESGPDRRSVMKAAALAAVPVAGVGTVAACSSGGSGKSSGSGGGSAGITVPSSSVPVGGGFVDTSKLVVVTQPQAGVFKAFSAVCTHQGCTVKDVSNNQIHCPCHGSIFSAQDGSVLNGPATSPLGAMPATVNGANVEVAGTAKS
ncbi:MAG: (2Fe-2S)-binding protein [Catenulispora sp. 13_1_20CM_3_70_7]|jgi:Rieske Fe-S protein|nr:Rieske (2Fe-2S) protein [Catenulisporales bacterium]OLE23292.1 MAG: (2Fe-2S)-binding protein [Catenulispora sp. 13_1_20CM_3_70_7]